MFDDPKSVRGGVYRALGVGSSAAGRVPRLTGGPAGHPFCIGRPGE